MRVRFKNKTDITIFIVRVILYKVTITRTNMEKKSKEQEQCKTLLKPECDIRPDCKFSKITRKCRRKITNSKTTRKSSQPEHSRAEEEEEEVKQALPPQVIHIEEAPIVIDPCDEKESTKKEAAEINKKIAELKEKCNEQKYKNMEKFNDKKLMDLIVYIYEKKIEHCPALFNQFPTSSERTKGRLSTPYIFEALWKIIFLLQLDNLTDGDRYDREYKKSIEGTGPANDISSYAYLNGETPISKINSGSESGIADFYFTVTERPLLPPEKRKPGIPNACEEVVFIPRPNDIYIFTSKYYGKEKGISNYDIEKIALEALHKYQDKNFKIVSLVKNGAEYKNRLERSSKELVKSYVSSNLIFDESDLITIYYPKLYKFLTHWFDEARVKKKGGKEKRYSIKNEADWRKILKDPKEIIYISDNLRFHQKYIVEYTNDLIDEGGKAGRFIWGAVARSGKSYMVGGLVAKRKPKIVLLILGAVNETKSQFIDDLFRKYTELQDYKVVDFQDSKKGDKEDDKEKYVFVISQEALRKKIKQEQEQEPVKTSGEVVTVTKPDVTAESYSDDTMDKIKQLLQEEDKIIFFDEIHQGSGIDSMQEDTIGFFYNPLLSPHKIILIMVTATYANPLAKYGKTLDVGENDCTLIEWDYEMIMKMKNFQIENVTFDEQSDTSENSYLINRNDAQFVKKMTKLKVITEELNKQNKSCQDIAYEYKNYPELVYLLPTLKENYVGDQELMSKDYIISEEADGHKIDIRNKLKEIFKLNQARKFTYKNSVNKLLCYIYNDVYEKLLFKKYDYIATGEGNIHSQLWFLPTSMKNEPKPHKRPAAAGAAAAAAAAPAAGAEPEEDATIVGPMLKELGLAIINHRLFINFNVCVVHSAKETETDTIVSTSDAKAEEKDPRTLYFKCIKSKNVKECIKDIENKSKQAKKSLIILTAQRLRLGISLPCADIAIHMDNLKAYDIIYQSMFRVLTERAGKTHGFFVDMVLDRAIQFMYKYTQTSKKSDTINGIEKDDVVKSLLLFDVGSIKQSVGFTSITDTAVNSYRDIAEKFKVDSDEKFNAWKDELSKDPEFNEGEKKVKSVPEEKPLEETDADTETGKKTKMVIKLLHDIDDKDPAVKSAFDDILKSLQFTKSQKKQTKAKDKKGKFVANVLEPSQGAAPAPAPAPAPEPAPAPPEEEDREQLFKNIVEQLKNMFSLLILFDDSDSALEDILKLKKINDNIAKIKKCEDPDIMYYCYLIANINNIHKIGDKAQDDESRKIGKIENIEIKDKKEKTEGKKTTYTIKFQDETKIYTEADFKKHIKNLSIPNNFELEQMDPEFINGFLQKNIALIQFLLKQQSKDKHEINNLYDNIKKEMKKTKLTDQLKEEKDAFKDTPLNECPEDFIKNVKNEKVLDIIRKYLTPKDSEKKLFGEVFTPLNLICEMLSKLPTNVWTNQELKWLDPANGIGNFPVVVYYKLMEGLKHEIKDDDARSKHIIENMIYMSELNPVNVALAKKVFKMIDPGSTPNVIRADFITGSDAVLKKMRDDARDETRFFDIIIGNPPYNSGGIRAKTTENIKHDKEVQENAKTIWPQFVENSLSILKKESGYLLFIHPASWIGFKGANGEIFKKIQIKYLRYYNVVTAHKLFGNQSGEIPLTYYVLQNANTTIDTTIFDNATEQNEEFNIYKYNFVPTESISLWKKILTFTKKHGSLIDNYSSVKKPTNLSETISSASKYPIISVVKKVVVEQYSDTNNNKNNDKKLLLANSSMGYPIYDYLGFMYPESADQFILYSNNNEKELKQLQNYFLTNLLFYLINITKTRQKFFDNKIFEVIPNITKITKSDDINDDFLIKTFKLTPNDLVGYEKYTEGGEGRLDDSVKKTIQNFKLNIPKETIREIKEENKGKMEQDEMKKSRKDDTKKHTGKLKHAKTMRAGAKKHNNMRRSIRKRIYPTGGKKKTVKNKIRFSLW